MMLRVALLSGFALVAPALCADESEYTAVFPARGLLDLDEGTIEYWIKLGFDPQEQHGNWLGRGSVFWVDLGDRAFPNDGLSGSIGTRPEPRGPQRGDVMRAVTRFGIVLDGREFPHPTFTYFPETVARGEWHHFAMTWSRRQSHGSVDGQPAGPYEYRETFARALGATARFGVGQDPRSPYIQPQNPIAIDDLRISSVARRPEDLGFSRGALKPDGYTLLLIDFEQAENALAPAYSAVGSIAAPPMPARWRVIDGKFGRGVALDPQAFEPPAETAAHAPAP